MFIDWGSWIFAKLDVWEVKVEVKVEVEVEVAKFMLKLSIPDED